MRGKSKEANTKLYTLFIYCQHGCVMVLAVCKWLALILSDQGCCTHCSWMCIAVTFYWHCSGVSNKQGGGLQSTFSCSSISWYNFSWLCLGHSFLASPENIGLAGGAGTCCNIPTDFISLHWFKSIWEWFLNKGRGETRMDLSCYAEWCAQTQIYAGTSLD